MTDIFQDGQVPVVDPTKDYLSELVGEDKTYKSPADLARAVAEKEAFIVRLKGETAGLRNELSGRIKMEDVLTRIEAAQTKGISTPVVDEPPVRTDTPTPPDIEKLIEDRLNQKEAQRTHEANAKTVSNKLQEVYGGNYAIRVQQELAKFGMTPAEGNRLAVTNPQAFLQLLGIGQPQPVRSVTPPNTQTLNFTPNTASDKTYSYYEKIRKENPSLYFQPRIQNEMLSQLRELGQEEFYR